MNKFQRRTMIKSKLNNQDQQQKSDYIYQTAKKQYQHRERDQVTNKRRAQYRDENNQRSRMQRRPLKDEIQQLYKGFMEQSQYTQAEKAQATIKYLNDRQKAKRVRKLSQQHSIEKLHVKEAHQNEMKYFRQAWKELFMEQAMKQRMMMQRLQRIRKIDQQQCKERITKRCQSAKPTVSISKLEQVQLIEKSLRKRGKTVQLRSIREEKKRLIKRCREEQERTLIQIAEEQRKRMVDKQTRRYRSFMHRIQEGRRDNDRIYRREQHKLKQKFKNILKNLEHQQKKDFNQLQRSYIV